MTKLELNKLLASEITKLEPCEHWRRVWYNDQGAALLRDATRCQHPDGKCYSVVELVTFIGKLGGPPAYCNSSQAGLVLLAELKRLCDLVVLSGQDSGWTLEMYDFQEVCSKFDGSYSIVKIAGPVPAPTAEMAIALTAAEFAGVKLTAEDISA